jgi:hypothetical protein
MHLHFCFHRVRADEIITIMLSVIKNGHFIITISYTEVKFVELLLKCTFSII